MTLDDAATYERLAAMEPSDLTFEAERFGSEGGSCEVLLALLAHPSAVVREGVCIGLEHHLADPRVRAALSVIAATDPSPGVRAAVDLPGAP